MLQAGPAKKKSLDTEGGDGGPQVRLGLFDPPFHTNIPLASQINSQYTLRESLSISHYPRCYVIYSGLLSEADNCLDAPSSQMCVSSLLWPV